MIDSDQFFRAQVDAISRSNFAFATDLHQRLASGSENLVFSPFSITLMLLMARFGARGRTANQIETAMKLPLTYNTSDLELLRDTRQGFFKILQTVNEPVEEYDVTVANRLYTTEGFSFNKDFRRISKQVLNISAANVDFSNGLAASDSINAWVKNLTGGKIDQLFTPDSFDADTKLVMVNAIYFKSPWKFPFDAEDTGRAPFYTSRHQFQVDTMVAEDAFPFGDLPELNSRIVAIHYRSPSTLLPREGANYHTGRFSMHVIIPKHTFGLKRTLKGLRNMTMDRIRGSLRKPGLCETVKLHLPKFKIESTLDLVQPLQQMGATDMFSESEADFSGIPRNLTRAPKLFMSQVIQKAFIAVDEEGTEAAAATEIRAGVTCFPTVTEIKADRPFYYQIVEEDTNTVLFAGVVRNPNA